MAAYELVNGEPTDFSRDPGGDRRKPNTRTVPCKQVRWRSGCAAAAEIGPDPTRAQTRTRRHTCQGECGWIHEFLGEGGRGSEGLVWGPG